LKIEFWITRLIKKQSSSHNRRYLTVGMWWWWWWCWSNLLSTMNVSMCAQITELLSFSFSQARVDNLSFHKLSSSSSSSSSSLSSLSTFESFSKKIQFRILFEKKNFFFFHWFISSTCSIDRLMRWQEIKEHGKSFNKKKKLTVTGEFLLTQIWSNVNWTN